MLLHGVLLLCSLAYAEAGHCYTSYSTCESCAGAPSGNCGWCAGSCVMAYDGCDSEEIAVVPEMCGGVAAPKLPGNPFFQSITEKMTTNPAQKNYGVSITDFNGDGQDEFFVTGFGAPNQAFTYDKATDKYIDLLLGITEAQDTAGKAIGVSACDVDEDGIEEVFILNTDSYSGPTTKTSVRLYKRKEGGVVDLFSLPENQDARAYAAGRSVACVDRTGDGRYGVMLANYGLPFNLYEVDADSGLLRNVASEVGVVQDSIGGRALVSGPILSDFAMDVFANNENSANWMMKNDGGSFKNVAGDAGLLDGSENGRGTALFDADDDGLIDIVYGNWNGRHRLFMQDCEGKFTDTATAEMKVPSPIRTVIAADFDNDGFQEIFFNNIPGSNRLFSRSADGKNFVQVDIGDALEVSGRGTGAGVADLDGDGRLELLVSHGESASQPLSMFVSKLGLGNAFLRVRPLTASGAPARGATVRAHHASGRTQLQVIDAGSGYLCQQEPVAHFGLGAAPDNVERLVVRWPNGDVATIENAPFNATLTVSMDDGVVKVKAKVVDQSTLRGPIAAKLSPEEGSLREAVCKPKEPVSTPEPTCIETGIPNQVNDLHNRYSEIFKMGNRNAASHLWAAYLLDRSCAMSLDKAEELFAGFCPVSGSPVTPRPDGGKTYLMNLPRVDGSEQVSGMVHFCCTPCVCDTNDLIKVDTKTVQFKDGAKKLNFLVIGDPCRDESALDEPYDDPFGRGQETLRRSAPELMCDKAGKLKGAYYSDHGNIIIGLLGEMKNGQQYNDGTSRQYMDYCEQRAQEGYRSGMGLIFRLAAGISAPSTTLVAPPKQTPGPTETTVGSSGEVEVEIADQQVAALSSSSTMRGATGALIFLSLILALFLNSIMVG